MLSVDEGAMHSDAVASSWHSFCFDSRQWDRDSP